jgi:hypothetical protein
VEGDAIVPKGDALVPEVAQYTGRKAKHGGRKEDPVESRNVICISGSPIEHKEVA